MDVNKYCKYCGRKLKTEKSIKNNCGSWCKKKNELKFKNYKKISDYYE